MAKNELKCPVLRGITQDDMCMESFSGLGAEAWVFMKEDFNQSKPKLDFEKNKYFMTKDTFKTGRGLYKLELKSGSQSITGESQKKRGGFKQTATLVIEVVNEETSDLLRALNNRDWGLIMPDGDKFQILYLHTSQKITIDAGGLKTETGAAASDDRVTTINVSLENCYYPNTYLELEGEGITIESLLATDQHPSEEEEP